MSRGGRKLDQEGAQRRCISTGEVQDKAGLLRFVVGPDQQILFDVAAKLPGRGIYVAAQHAALHQAINKRLFARGAKQSVQVPEDLAAQVEALLVKRVITLLSLARKSGDAKAGFDKVKDAVVNGTVATLLQAADGSVAQKAKIRPPIGQNSHISCLSGAELGLAFGRENVIHAALAAGGLRQRIVEEATRLTGIRGT